MMTYKFRLYPNKEQRSLLAQTFGCSRLVYNKMLDLRINYYQEHKDDKAKKGLSTYDCAKYLPLWKSDPELDFLKDVDSIALQSSNEDLGRAYENFFRKRGKFPRFKRKDAKQSYRTKNVGNAIRVNKNRIKLPKLGLVKFAKSREIKGKIKTVTISKTVTDKYYIAVVTDYELTSDEKWKKVEKAIGIDVGLTHYAIYSDSTKIKNPRHLKKWEEKLKKEQVILSRRLNEALIHNRKLSDCKNYQKQRIKVAKLHEKVRNSRLDFLQKLSTDIVKNHEIICVESLSVKNMVKNHNLARVISDAAWGTFLSMLEYKAKRHDRTLNKIGKFFPSSQICSNCGNKDGKKELNVRSWTCSHCGVTHDRDINAAINILVEGMK